MDHAEVAVNGSRGVEEIGAGAGRVQSTGDFKTYIGGFAGAGDSDTARALRTDAHEYIDGLEKGIVQAARDEFESRRFSAEDTTGVVEPPIRPGRRIRQMDLQGHLRLHAR